MVTAKGKNGTVEFDGRLVKIKRRGLLGAGTYGRNDKAIPVNQITAVQFRRWSIFDYGAISFTIGGALETPAKLGKNTKRALKDENAVIFSRGQQEQMTVLRDAVLATLATV